MEDTLLNLWVLAGIIGYLIFFVSAFAGLVNRVRGFLNALTHPSMTVEHVVRREDSLPVIDGTARPGKPYKSAEEAAGGIEAMQQLRKGKN